MMKQLYIVLLGVFVFLATGCVSSKDPAELFKGQTDQQIYTGAEKALVTRHYSDAVKHYQGLNDLYPFSPYSQQAMLDSIYAYYQSGDYATASATASQFIHLYPASPHIDYAYYMKGVADMVKPRTFSQRYLPINLSTRDLASSEQAYDDFAVFVKKFPTSIYTPDATLRMTYLRNLFAQYQLDIAEFYFKRHAYVGSANRANAVLKNYPDSSSQKQAMDLLQKSQLQMAVNKRL